MNYPYPSNPRDLISGYFPGISPRRCTLISEGWDSYVFDVEGSYIFKFPRNETAWNSLKKENTLLGELRKFLSVSLPNHEFVQEGNASQPFVGYRRLPGSPVSGFNFDESGSIFLSRTMSRFYSEMRTFPIEVSSEMGVATVNGQQWKKKVENDYEMFRVRALPLMGKREMQSINQLFDAYLEDSMNFEFDPILIHGDLNGDHILLDPEGSEEMGVLGWGDAAVSDPARDFAWLYDAMPENLVLRTIIDAGHREPAGILKRSKIYNTIGPLYAIAYYYETGDKKRVKQGLKILSERLQ